MASIRRFTTPVHTITLPGVDLTSANVYVTYRQGNITVTVSDVTVSKDGDDTKIMVPLTQEQTAKFNAGDPFMKESQAMVEVNWIINGSRDATEIDPVDIKPNLLERVI